MGRYDMRFFNTAGPCIPEFHYMVPPLPRLPEAPKLIHRGMYFVVHAPRQTGKTTTLRALAHHLSEQGKYAAVHVSCEKGIPAGDDHGAAQMEILGALREEAELTSLPDDCLPPDPWPDGSNLGLFSEALRAWSRHCPRPLVLFLDEIDSLTGRCLNTILRQLRSDYPSRPDHFPHSVVLCGMRDVRDYKAASGGDPRRLGTASPFNISVRSFRLDDFTFDEVRDLYLQHTEETGQPFRDDAIERAFEGTQGQPWLTNALAYEIIDMMRVDPPEPITAAHMDKAKKRIIAERFTHLDSLTARLDEPWVQEVLDPLLAGEFDAGDLDYDDRLSYVRDLGIIARNDPIRLANPIYSEIVTRALTAKARRRVRAKSRDYVLEDGRLDFPKLLEGFRQFWRQNGEALATRPDYNQAAPQLVFMAYVQKIVNDGGFIDREFAVGSGRVDLHIRWPYKTSDGTAAMQHEAIELKIWWPKKADPLPQGLAQLDRYLDRLGVDQGTLVIFDRRDTAAPWEERGTIHQSESPDGRAITVVRA